MKHLRLAALFISLLICPISYSADESFDSPLEPGTTIIAGDLSKNEFFIVAEKDVPKLKLALEQAARAKADKVAPKTLLAANNPPQTIKTQPKKLAQTKKIISLPQKIQLAQAKRMTVASKPIQLAKAKKVTLASKPIQLAKAKRMTVAPRPIQLAQAKRMTVVPKPIQLAQAKKMTRISKPLHLAENSKMTAERLRSALQKKLVIKEVKQQPQVINRNLATQMKFIIKPYKVSNKKYAFYNKPHYRKDHKRLEIQAKHLATKQPRMNMKRYQLAEQ